MAEAAGWILDSLDDINSVSDGMASRDLDFMQHVFRDKTLHMLMEVVLHSSLCTVLSSADAGDFGDLWLSILLANWTVLCWWPENTDDSDYP